MKKAKAVYEFLPIYNRHIFYSNSVQAARDLVKKSFKAEEVDLTAFDDLAAIDGIVIPVMCPNDDERVRAFVVIVLDEAQHWYGTIGHECNHLKNKILFYLGHELDELNDEAESYLVGYLVQAFHEKIGGAKVEKVKTK